MDIIEAVDIYVMIWKKWFVYWVYASAPTCIDGKFVYPIEPVLTWDEYKKQMNHAEDL